MSKISRILITGGTGSFGQCFVRRLLEENPDLERLVVFSRDELKQWDMAQKYNPSKYPNLRFFLGDVRDLKRLTRAMEGIDTVIHAAALKQVPAAEYNPVEFINTNIRGAENVIEASFLNNVKRVVALSTDKACAPINLYGATKLCSDKLFVAANNVRGSRDIKFSIVRYGNVMGSRGSVIPFFLKQRETNTLTITDDKMTRFNISLDESVDMVLWALQNSLGSEIFVPKIPSYRIIDVAEAIGPSCKKLIIGSRSGEKIHEEMISSSDSNSTYDLGDYYAIKPSLHQVVGNYAGVKPKLVVNGFNYNSGTNEKFLNVDELRTLIKKNVDQNFTL